MASFGYYLAPGDWKHAQRYENKKGLFLPNKPFQEIISLLQQLFF